MNRDNSKEGDMDPITRALVEYNGHLENGGKPVYLGLGIKRTIKRKLHPSSLGPGLCDRRAAYSIMKDMDEIEAEEHSDKQLLSFRVGHVFQDFVAQALAFKGIKFETEFILEDEDFTGRPDFLIDYSQFDPKEPHYMLVDVKAVKSWSVSEKKDTYYPQSYHVAQLEKYKSLLTGGGYDKYVRYSMPVRPYLFVVTRLDLDSVLLTWDWDEDDLKVRRYGEDEYINPRKFDRNLRVGMRESEEAQLEWLHGGDLPDRCVPVPDMHKFMCGKVKKGGIFHPSCQYFELCWERKPEPFKKGQWEGERHEVW